MKKHILIAVFVGFIFSANAQILNIEQQRLDSDIFFWNSFAIQKEKTFIFSCF